MLLRRILGGIVCHSSAGVNVCMGLSSSKPAASSTVNGAAVLTKSSQQSLSSNANNCASMDKKSNNSRASSAASSSSSASLNTASTTPQPSQRMLHQKCRNCLYTRTKDVQRFPCPDDKVAWSVSYEEYDPPEFTGPSVAAKPVWADPDFKNEGGNAEWNSLDGKVDRRSHIGQYEIVGGVPRNPIGRTGICGRGHLGRWGPNHAADPIVTRWKRTSDGSIATENGHQVLQFIAIQRGDNGEWALPGGMVDPGERVSATLKREFLEEALDVANMSEETKQTVHERIGLIFQGGKEVYRGYVDDPRNTDNAWMETVAVNFHDETGESVGKFKLHAGDDAVGVQWTDMNSKLALYASHLDFISKVASMHNAFW